MGVFYFPCEGGVMNIFKKCFQVLLFAMMIFCSDLYAEPLALVVNRKDSTVSVIDVAIRKVVGDPILVGKDPKDIVITSDGKLALVCNAGDKTVSVIDVASRKVVGNAIKVPFGPYHIAIIPNSKRALVTPDKLNAFDPKLSDHSQHSSISIIDVEKGEVTGNSIEINEVPTGIKITSNGKWALVATDDENIVVIDVEKGTVFKEITDVADSPDHIALSPDGEKALLSEMDPIVRVIKVPNGELVGKAIQLKHIAGPMAITPDGTLAVVLSNDNKGLKSKYSEITTHGVISVIDLVKSEVAGDPISVGKVLKDIAITKDGRFALVTNYGHNTVSVIDIKGRAIDGEPIQVGNLPWGIAIVP